MKLSSLGALSGAIMFLAAPAAVADQHTTGDGAMTDVTCEEFLGLSATDQEMHATALTTAQMDETMPPDASDESSAEAPDMSGEDTGPDNGDATSEDTAVPTEGLTRNILSPTVVALVTICENTEGDTGSDDGEPSSN